MEPNHIYHNRSGLTLELYFLPSWPATFDSKTAPKHRRVRQAAGLALPQYLLLQGKILTTSPRGCRNCGSNTGSTHITILQLPLEGSAASPPSRLKGYTDAPKVPSLSLTKALVMIHKCPHRFTPIWPPHPCQFLSGSILQTSFST